MPYELKKSTNDKFYFSLKAGNGQKILASEMYESKASALNGIKSVQENCTKPERYSRETSSNGKFYFNLKAGNHQVIGSSEMYESAASRDNGIQSVTKNGPDTTVVDNT